MGQLWAAASFGVISSAPRADSDQAPTSRRKKDHEAAPPRYTFHYYAGLPTLTVPQHPILDIVRWSLGPTSGGDPARRLQSAPASSADPIFVQIPVDVCRGLGAHAESPRNHVTEPRRSLQYTAFRAGDDLGYCRAPPLGTRVSSSDRPNEEGPAEMAAPKQPRS